MGRKKNGLKDAETLRQEIAFWVKEEPVSAGAWDMFVLCTLKDLQKDYAITMECLEGLEKEQFDFVCDAIEDVVYHFQKIEMVELIERLYTKFYGEDQDTELYRTDISGLRNCIKAKQ